MHNSIFLGAGANLPHERYGSPRQTLEAALVELGRRGARTLELNLERSQGSAWFDETRLGPASELVPAWVAEMLDG